MPYDEDIDVEAAVMKIHPQTLKALREKNNLSQEALAEVSGVSKRSISRLEQKGRDPGKSVRAHTVNELAKALKVQAQSLGEPPGARHDAGKELTRHGYKTLRVFVDGDTAWAYSTVKRRYGVTPRDLVSMAPLFFVLLAEGSLLWRRERLTEIHAAIDSMRKAGEIGGHLSFTNAVYRIEDGAGAEEASVRAKDIFGEKLGQDAFDFNYDPRTSNPFAEYLRHLSKQIDDPDAVQLDPLGDELWNMQGHAPEYRIGAVELDRLTGGDVQAVYALTQGYVRIPDIPADLLGEQRLDDRVTWLRERIPPDIREQFNISDLDLDDLFAGSSDEGEGEA